jgi:hypothetical protein
MEDVPRAGAGEEEELAAGTAGFAFPDAIREILKEGGGARPNLEMFSAGRKGIWSKEKGEQ